MRPYLPATRSLTTALVVAFATLAAPVNAAMYEYVGQPFETEPGETPGRITGVLTLDKPLPPNLGLDSLQTIDFEAGFSLALDAVRGGSRIEIRSERGPVSAAVSTDESGRIVEWSISGAQRLSSGFDISVATRRQTDQTDPFPLTFDRADGPFDTFGQNVDAPGEWSLAKVPLPSSVLLLLSACGGLALVGARRRQRA